LPTRLGIGYRWLRQVTAKDIVAVHDEVSRVGNTWHFGIRETGSLDHLAGRIREMASQRRPPLEIAAFAMVFLVREHPFWDANHRTAFEVAELIVEAFGQRIAAGRDEAEAFVRGIDARGLGREAILEWLRSRVTRLR